VEASERTHARCNRCARRVIYIGLAEAIILIVLKVTLGLASGSRALVAASLYSIQDLVSAIIAALGLRISNKPPDRDHPYGHEKVEYLAVILMSVMLLLGIVGLAITSLASFFGDPSQSEPPTLLAVWVAAACAVACRLNSGHAECAGTKLNSPALRSYGAHMDADYLSSIAVLVSVVGAKLGFPILDHIVAILEAFHVVYTSGRMLGSGLNGLMDNAVEPQLIDKLERVVVAVASVTRVRRATARWAGQRLLAQVEVEVPGSLCVADADQVRMGVQSAVRTNVCRRSETFVRISPPLAGPSDNRVEAAPDGDQPVHRDVPGLVLFRGFE
jgi:cation diffusion facilitator family transporter